LLLPAAAMLADFLEGHRQEVLRGVESRAAAEEVPGPLSPEHRERIRALVGSLVEALRQGHACDEPTVTGAFDGAEEFRDRELVRVEVISQAERSGTKVALDEMAVVSDWVFLADRSRLREGCRELRELLDETQDDAAILSPDGRFAYVNRRFAQELHDALGIPPDQVVGTRAAELRLPPEYYIARPPDELVAAARHTASRQAMWGGRWKEGKLKAIYSDGGDVAAIALVGRDIHDPKLRHVRMELLAKLNALVGCVDSDEVAEALARVPIPELADWCVVNLLEKGRISRSFVALRDPSKAALREAALRAVPDWRSHPLWAEMGLTSGFQLLTDVSDELLRRLAASEEQYRVMREAGVRSIMVQPIVSRGEAVAILTLIHTTESGRRYSHDDPPLVREFALHAAHLIENARLLTELRASDNRFRVSLAGARTLVFEQNASLGYVWYYNPIPPRSFVGKTDEEMLGAEDAALLKELKRQVLETGESVQQELAVTADGEHMQFREVLEPIRNRAGKVVGVSARRRTSPNRRRLSATCAKPSACATR
jgi:GAF domain-containing protein